MPSLRDRGWDAIFGVRRNTEDSLGKHMINLADYYSGGYFLIRPGRPDWGPNFGLYLPHGDLISLSHCICRDRLQLSWGWTPGDHEAAQRFGIRDERWEEFRAWCGDEYKKSLDYNGMFHSVDAARAFVRRFNLNHRDLVLIGVGLPKALFDLWSDEAPDAAGISKRIQARLAVEVGGEVLGYDVVSFDYGDFGHSWLCSGLDEDMHDLYGIRPNQDGLITTFDDAKKVYDWIAEDEGKGHRGEPEPYHFWLLMSYPL
jgi:hypothetical protein